MGRRDLPVDVAIPPPFAPLFRPARFKVFYGGRGSAKSWSVAKVLAVKTATSKLRILCTREFQNSIADSVHRLLQDQIDTIGLRPFFRVTDKAIVSAAGSEFLFKGLRHNVNEIKSLEGVDICWVEEAQRVSKASWEILIPTIRKAGSEIWVTFNPEDEDDPTYAQFVSNPRPDSVVRKVNYSENPYFPDVLRREMEYLKSVDHDAYLHVWEGFPRTQTNAVIFKGKFVVESFDTPADVDRFFFGADWGFAQDPTTLVRFFIRDECLFVDHEAYGIGVEIAGYDGNQSETAQLFRSVPGSDKWPIKADSARPETISAIRHEGFNVQPAKKWQGCVEDGIAFLRSFKRIVIHERCVHTAQEFGLYSYKVDRVTGDILPVIADLHNHCVDAIRYGLDGYINQEHRGLFEYIRGEYNAMKGGM